METDPPMAIPPALTPSVLASPSGLPVARIVISPLLKTNRFAPTQPLVLDMTTAVALLSLDGATLINPPEVALIEASAVSIEVASTIKPPTLISAALGREPLSLNSALVLPLTVALAKVKPTLTKPILKPSLLALVVRIAVAPTRATPVLSRVVPLST